MSIKKRKPCILLVGLLALMLVFSGCATMKQAACSPTAAQIDQAAQFAAQVAVMQPFFPPASVVGAALQAVLPFLLTVKDGYCVSDQDNFLAYVASLLQGAEKKAMAKGFKGFKNPNVQQKVMLKKMEQ